MNKFLQIVSKPIIVTLLVLIVDQWLKIWVKTNMQLGDDIPIFGNWFQINFIENNGMAFGMEFGGEWGKFFLSMFRIVAVCGIGYYLFRLPKSTHKGLMVSVALIFAGAIGNIIDSAFYGLIFNESFNQLATFMPAEGGYATFLHGRVVDMLYFPLMEGNFPEWMPIWGGEHFLFFRPVFNIADASISIGIGLIFIFNKRFFKKNEEELIEKDATPNIL